MPQTHKKKDKTQRAQFENYRFFISHLKHYQNISPKILKVLMDQIPEKSYKVGDNIKSFIEKSLFHKD